MASRGRQLGYLSCGNNKVHCCGGNNNYCNNNNVNNNNNEMLPIYFDQAILHRIAFTVWHTALHLEREIKPSGKAKSSNIFTYKA
ncbi:hypothetical protein L9F63_006492, partial [Diploptera punctata]